MILEDATFEAYGYYPRDLSRRSGRPIKAACDDCGKVRETTKHMYRSRCLTCSQKGRAYSDAMILSFYGSDSPNWKGGQVKCICPTCGNEFEAYPYRLKKGKKIYCSRSCATKAHKGAETPNFKGGKAKYLCPVCNKHFEGYPSQSPKDNDRCCSIGCANILKLHNGKSLITAPEKVFESVSTKYNLPFLFNGNGPIVINHATPDFVHTGGKKIVVEIFGSYWHSSWKRSKDLKYNQTADGRAKQFKPKGYKLIVFWESDLMRENADKFVLRELEKAGVIWRE